MQFTLDNLLDRYERVRRMEHADKERFKPNPLGPGYLTRYERYTEVFRELKRRIEFDT